MEELKPLPNRLLYILQYYQELKTDKAIDFNEIACWSNLTGIELSNFEIKAIRLIDQIQLNSLYD